MEKEQNHWRIHIDTGGTFTDCLAYTPGRQLIRIKVLSSSALRATVKEVVNEKQCLIQANWPVERNIFRDYLFFAPSEEKSIPIQSYDPDTGLLSLQEKPPFSLENVREFEISAGEEAPVLACRLATQTGLHEDLPPIDMRLGSTRGTNALLERKGASTALLLTKGFRDLLLIDTQQRPNIFSLQIERGRPYYREVLEVDERMNADGEVVRPLLQGEIARVIRKLQQTDVHSVAIALMHSYLNPVHEKLLKEKLEEAGYAYVSASAALAPAIRLLPRAKTALVNAYLQPLIHDYLSSVKDKLSAGSLKVMTSAGGLVDAAHYHPKDSLLSGPAGGVAGAASIARLAAKSDPALQKILTLDMGGTSTDVSRYDGEFDYRYETRVGDISLFSPTLAIETVAAGGGSCCNFDGYKLSVGPESAGAYPGPASYGFGGPLSLTDVNLLLGRLCPDRFGIPLSRAKAGEALQALKEQMQASSDATYSDEEILQGLLNIANEKMADAIRKISVRKGYDPQEYALLAFGGAGGQHACRIAEMIGVRQVIIPYDAGLLSAYGMGQALIERFAARQLLRPLSEVSDQLNSLSEALQKEAREQLKQEGFSDTDIQTRFVRLSLRFAGQDNSLEIDYRSDVVVEQVYREKYEALFGHWLKERTIEVESIRAVASTYPQEHPLPAKDKPYVPEAAYYQNCFTGQGWQEVPVFNWEELQTGAHLQGPALLASDNCTTLVETGWQLHLDAFNNAILKQFEESEHQQETSKPEEVQLELFTNRFSAVVEEMGSLLERTSFSVNVKERLDFSCALLDESGELVVNAPHIPVHLGSMGLCVRSVARQLSMEEGDVVITNHPAYGGSHLPDITLISPVFYKEKLVAYVANRAHHAEIGGKRPGSMPADARSLQEEGVVIAPTYLFRKGKARWQEIRQIMTDAPFPTRSLEENMADLNGALASVRAGVEAVQRLCDSRGVDRTRHYMRLLKKYAADSLQDALRELPETNYSATETLDDSTPLSVFLQLSGSGGRPRRLLVSLEGSGAVHPANLNATPAIVNSALIYVLRLLIRRNIPLNEGIMRHVRLELAADSLLNPRFPDRPEACPAVVGGNTETSQRLVDTFLKALQLAACSQGTMNNLLFGNDHFGYYETIGGGSGAGPGFHGADAVHQHMTNTRITDPEVLEFRYPVRLDTFSIRRGSGGKGRWPGGDGIFRQITFLEKVSLTLLTQHRRIPPYGLAGGLPGREGRQYILQKDNGILTLQGIDQAELEPGDAVVIETPGGGGYGSPDAGS